MLDAAPTGVGSYTLKISIAATKNYSAVFCQSDFSISKRAITGNFDSSFVYNGTSVNYIDVSTDNNVLADDVKDVQIQVSMTSKNVGATANNSGIVTVGDKGDNYSITSEQITSATITKKPLTGTITKTKVYDGNDMFYLVPSDLSGTIGLLSGDVIGFEITMTSKNVDATVKSTVITGTHKGNYSYDGINFSADITQKAFTGTLDVTKVYNGNPTLYANAGSGKDYNAVLANQVVSGDNIEIKVDMSSENVDATLSAWTITGNAADNYAKGDMVVTAGITKKTLTPVRNLSWEYDGQCYLGGYSLTANDGIVLESELGHVSLVVYVESKNVGNDVTLDAAKTILSGSTAINNYSLDTSAIHVNITKKTIAPTVVFSKTYDGTYALTPFDLTAAYGICGTDVVTLHADAVDKNVGTTAIETDTGVTYLDGTDAGNYTLDISNLSCEITQKTITGFTLRSTTKTGYDYVALTKDNAGIIEGDVIELAIGGQSVAGTYKIVDSTTPASGETGFFGKQGKDAANYNIVFTTTCYYIVTAA